MNHITLYACWVSSGIFLPSFVGFCSLDAIHQALCIDTNLNNCNISNLCHWVLYLSKSSMNKLNRTNSSTGGFPLSQELAMFCSLPSSMFKQIVYPFNDHSFYSSGNKAEWWNSEVKKKIFFLRKTRWGKIRKKSQERRKLFKLPVCLISLEHIKRKTFLCLNCLYPIQFNWE